MPAVFEFFHRVAPHEIDVLGHANNVAYVQWMQDAALAHSATQGWPAQRYQDLGSGWVVRAHAITYHEPARAGDEICVRTWVATMNRVTSLRRYRIYRATDQTLLAHAETNWAFVDYAGGRPKRVPAEIAAAFVLVPDSSPLPLGEGQG